MSAAVATEPAVLDEALEGPQPTVIAIDSLEASMEPPDSAVDVPEVSVSSMISMAPEILHRILVEVGSSSLKDLAAIAQTCVQLRLAVYNDSDAALWRELHNQLYDDPRGPRHRPRLSAGMDMDQPMHDDNKPTIEIDWRGECIARWRVRRRLAQGSFQNAVADFAAATASSRWNSPLKRKKRESDASEREVAEVLAAGTAGTEEAEGLGLADMLVETSPKNKARSVLTEVEVDPVIADEIAEVLLDMYRAMPVASDPSTSLNAQHLIRLVNSVAFERMYRKSFRRDSRYALRPIQGRAGRTQSRNDRIDVPHAGLAHLHALLGWGEECFRKSQIGEGEDTGDPQVDPEFGLIYDKDHLTSDVQDGRTPASATERVVSRRQRYLQHLGQHREITYSIAHYNERNDFGPLRPDGTVNWPVLDAIAAVMDANVSYVSGRSAAFRGRPAHGWEIDEWRRVPFPDRSGLEAVRAQPLSAIASRPTAADGDGDEDEQAMATEPMPLRDWAGIEGVWRGTYAFMDYTDWIQFNYSDMNILDRRPGIDISNYCEAIGQAMRMELTTNMSDFASRLPKIESTIPTSTALPPIEFCGVSTGGASVEGSHIRGTVSLTTDNPPEVRWTWVVRYSGFDRWRLDGIQVGGCKSRRGIVGMWSDVERADLSPVGPFTYWMTDGEEDEGSEIDGTFHVPSDLEESDEDGYEEDDDEDREEARARLRVLFGLED